MKNSGVSFIILGICIYLFGFLLCSFRIIEIEDRYGDLQDFYFKSKNGDLIVYGHFLKFGLVRKTSKHIGIKGSNGEVLDLGNWINITGDDLKTLKLYKTNNLLTTDDLDKEKLKYRTYNKEFELVLYKY
ncbi:MAG: hypothetical protein AAF487_07290 [Bacteroidota bacterium]